MSSQLNRLLGGRAQLEEGVSGDGPCFLGLSFFLCFLASMVLLPCHRPNGSGASQPWTKSLKLWGQISLSSYKLLFQVFGHGGKKLTNTHGLDAVPWIRSERKWLRLKTVVAHGEVENKGKLSWTQSSTGSFGGTADATEFPWEQLTLQPLGAPGPEAGSAWSLGFRLFSVFSFVFWGFSFVFGFLF